jgi:iron complex transport system substrate-binding protein
LNSSAELIKTYSRPVFSRLRHCKALFPVIAAVIAGVVLNVALGSCERESRREFIDREGNSVVLSGIPDRIISTAPSNTEIVIDLGLADRLIAVDKYSRDIPGMAPDLPLVDFFYPDAEAIIGLAPDIIIANGHNETGAGSDPFKLIRETGISVTYIPLSSSISAIYQDIEFLADVLGVPERGRELTERMKKEAAQIAEAVRGPVSGAVQGEGGVQDYSGGPPPKKQTVYFEISPMPAMVTFGQNTYLHDMLELIGAENIFASERGILFPSAEIIISKNPDVIFTNFNFGDTPNYPVEEIKTRPGFEYISAVQNNRVYLVDTDSTSRPSSRIMTAVKQMARILYAEYYETD